MTPYQRAYARLRIVAELAVSDGGRRGNPCLFDLWPVYVLGLAPMWVMN